MLQLPTTPKSHPVSLYGQQFLSYRPLWDKFTNDPQMTRNTKGRRYPFHILRTTTHDFQISLLFALWSAVFELEAIWEKCTKWQMTLSTKRSNVYLLTLETSSKFHSVLLYGKPGVHRMTQNMTSNTSSSKVPHIHVISAHQTTISPRFTLLPVVYELQAILRKSAPNDAKMTLST